MNIRTVPYIQRLYYNSMQSLGYQSLIPGLVSFLLSSVGERGYDHSMFKNQVYRLKTDDHNVPKLRYGYILA